MQIAPDWQKSGTVEALEEYIGNFKFDGPGMYLSKTDTMLIVPSECDAVNVWYQKWSKVEIFHCYVWNVPLSKTFFGATHLPPVRSDTR